MAVALRGTWATHSVIYPCPPFGLALLPHSTSCDKYIQCFAGVAVERDCGPGLHYNQTQEKCIDMSKADCYRNSCPLFNDPENLVYLPDYTDCTKYYLCYNNEPKAYHCAEGLHWSEEDQHCTTPALANCVDYEIVCRPDEISQLPNPRFCEQFYFCLFGTSFPSTCPGELLFDIRTGQCNYAGDAECYPGSVRP